MSNLDPTDIIAVTSEISEQLKSIQKRLDSLGLGKYDGIEIALKELSSTPEKLSKPYEQKAVTTFSKEVPNQSVDNRELLRFYLGISDDSVILYIIHWLTSQPKANLSKIESQLVMWAYGSNDVSDAIPTFWADWKNTPQWRIASEFMSCKPDIIDLSLVRQKILFWAFGKDWGYANMNNIDILIRAKDYGHPLTYTSLYDYLVSWSAENYRENTYRFGPDKA